MLAMLEQFSGLFKGVSDGRQGSGRPHLTNTTRYAPLTGRWLRSHSRTLSLRIGHATTFILICLQYEGLEWPGGGNMSLVGPKNDLLLFLNHVRYRHRNEHREFLIFTDFDMDFEDDTGLTGRIRRIPATRDNIASRIQDTMRDLERGEKCVLYYSGHIEPERDPQQTDQTSAYLLLPDNGQIHDHEIRVWLRLSRFRTATIIAIFDACYSGGFLALPYTHEKEDARITKIEAPSALPMASQIIEISSTTKDQLSFSERYGESGKDVAGTVHGILTWNLFQYLKGGKTWALEVVM
ncbi:hypothetical protein FS837_000876 [Tulasnella sp. UAMH 9824]|nr:hypothetical protein FS837_000876 [Tulasnella sp. UAMH 9824]